MLVDNSIFNSIEKTALQLNLELWVVGGGGPLDFIVSLVFFTFDF